MRGLVAGTPMHGGGVMTEVKLAVGADIAIGHNRISEEPTPVIDKIGIVENLAALEPDLHDGVGISPGRIGISRIIGRPRWNVGIGGDRQAPRGRRSLQGVDENIVLSHNPALVISQHPPCAGCREAAGAPNRIGVDRIHACERRADRGLVADGDDLGNLLGNAGPCSQAGSHKVARTANLFRRGDDCRRSCQDSGGDQGNPGNEQQAEIACFAQIAPMVFTDCSRHGASLLSVFEKTRQGLDGR